MGVKDENGKLTNRISYGGFGGFVDRVENQSIFSRGIYLDDRYFV